MRWGGLPSTPAARAARKVRRPHASEIVKERHPAGVADKLTRIPILAARREENSEVGRKILSGASLPVV
jgi:hypothetical protein